MSLYASELIRQVMNDRVNQVLSQLDKNESAIMQVESWLDDETSLASYRRELAFMLLSNLITYPEEAIYYAGNISVGLWKEILGKVQQLMQANLLPSLEFPPSSPDWALPETYASTYIMEQYRYGEAVHIQPGDIFLDCGACGGETAIWAIGQGAGKVYSFEPNPLMHPFIRRNTERHCPAGSVELVTRALADMPGVMNLVQGRGSVGEAHLHAGEEGTPVPVTTLDIWCKERQITPDFIKMDLEGYEVAALHGAQEIISHCRPKLAICLYHRLSDMWEIPAIVKACYPDYRLYCRKNALITEFVLYAEPV